MSLVSLLKKSAALATIGLAAATACAGPRFEGEIDDDYVRLNYNHSIDATLQDGTKLFFRDADYDRKADYVRVILPNGSETTFYPSDPLMKEFNDLFQRYHQKIDAYYSSLAE